MFCSIYGIDRKSISEKPCIPTDVVDSGVGRRIIIIDGSVNDFDRRAWMPCAISSDETLTPTFCR